MEQKDLTSAAETMVSVMQLIGKKLLKPEAACHNKSLAPSLYHILFILNDIGRMPVSEIGHRLHIAKPNMSHFIEKLHQEGFVERIPDKSDRRIIHIAITDKGKEMVREELQYLSAHLACILSPLCSEDLETLLMSLHHLKRILSKLS